MPFDTALSGIRAASTELTVTGNNIANASTTGFKSSRTEFGDVYATSALGSGGNSVGSGVQVQDVAQSFTQGNVAFSEKELDLAINGNGFFVLSNSGEQRYSRAGAFGLDDEGFIVNSSGALLQGFAADAEGNIEGIPGDLQIQTSNLDPRRTTLVESVLNLDASEPVLQSSGRQLLTEGVDISVTQVGRQSATTTELLGATFNLPLGNDFSITPLEFDLSLTGQGQNIGTVSISLDSNAGVPANVNTFNDLRILASVINAQIFAPVSPQTTIDVVAVARDLGGGDFSIDITAVEEGLNSVIDITNETANAGQIGLTSVLNSTSGVPAVTNGYPSQAINVISPDGDTVVYNTSAGATAAATASELNALQGVTATAQTNLTLSNYVNQNGNLSVTINGISLLADSMAAIEAEINSLSNTTLPGITATLNDTTGIMSLTSTGGDDIEVTITSIDDGDMITVLGDPDAASVTLEVDSAADGVTGTNADAAINSVIVGGEIDIVLDEGYDIEPQTSGGLFQPLNPDQFTDVVINEFEPSDQSTYNSATSMTIYDSLGNAHVLTKYFVKQEYDPSDATSLPNHWQVHIQVDGQDVGDPDTTLAPPLNTQATRATYDVFFNDDGTLNDSLTDPMLISNWIIEDSGAAGPQNVLAGGSIPIPDPPTSSNFVIDFSGTTQFGAAFSVADIDQNGYATGRLSGLSIDDGGIIFARFTNGESQILGQVALADFPNQEGLQPVGNSTWVENFRSGEPRIGAAKSGALGSIQSGALEESNVDISAELVNLIIAQRNFQASAKTIETADTVTQTIINLR